MNYEFDFDSNLRETQIILADSLKRVKSFVEQQRQVLNQKKQLQKQIMNQRLLNEETYKREISKIKSNIEQINKKSQNQVIMSQHHETEKQELLDEIQSIEKNFDKYQLTLDLLKDKYNRIRGEQTENNRNAMTLENQIKAYEFLYSLSITITNGKIKFVFFPSQYEVILNSSPDGFNLSETTLPANISISKLVDELNNTRDLFAFLSAIRSQL